MTSYAGFLAYRLKMQPEDFRVEELTHIRKVESSRFRLYELKKTSWNTVDAILRISREANISLKKFNYGGKKDRHATTKQFRLHSRQRNKGGMEIGMPEFNVMKRRKQSQNSL